MSAQNYLLQIAVGPVQDFISAARRTRDLWFGSAMLSEISKAVALAVHKEGCRLIFPSPQDPEADLAHSDAPDESLKVANVILAEVDGKSTDEIRAVCEKAKAAAQARLKAYSEDALERLKGNGLIDRARWEGQIGDLIEFYSAWVPVGQDYAVARKSVARLLAARKNVRDFGPNTCHDRVPKSSLDGLRETVFTKALDEKDVKAFPQDVRIKEREALDAVGMIKRMATQAFPSVSRVALDPWIRGRGRDFLQANKKDLKGFCDELIRLGTLNRVRAKKGDPFPYEGTALLVSRHDAMIKEAKDPVRARDLCARIEHYLDESFPKESQKPGEPYLAFLCADGDRMGATLAGMKTPDEHRKFSSTLAKFAGEARKIVESEHGVCVYAGGDDVMAFLPLDTALLCARRLRDAFHKRMKNFGEGNPPTLSVGLSIAHAMEDLELLLEYGRKAETAAKKGADGKAAERKEDRNGLAASVSSRGNVPITVRERWTQDLNSDGLGGMPLDQRLLWWAGRFARDEIPNKFPYELRENARFYDGWKDSETLKNAIQADALRIFGRKDVNLSQEGKGAVEAYIEGRVQDAGGLRALSDELILAQWIAKGLEQAQALDSKREEGVAE